MVWIWSPTNTLHVSMANKFLEYLGFSKSGWTGVDGNYGEMVEFVGALLHLKTATQFHHPVELGHYETVFWQLIICAHHSYRFKHPTPDLRLILISRVSKLQFSEVDGWILSGSAILYTDLTWFDLNEIWWHQANMPHTHTKTNGFYMVLSLFYHVLSIGTHVTYGYTYIYIYIYHIFI